MGKLIDADELKLRLKNLHLLATSGYGAEEVVGKIVDEMPEGVVRCKYCKHREDKSPGMVYCHGPVGGLVREDSFCTYWERRDDGV